jgi:spore coat polysaccharide biosynthesis protein SpsF (cytidylyltransferase family)
MMRNIAAVIQARLGSSRLPGKTLMIIKGETLLGHLIKRIKVSKYVTDIIISTTTNKIDDAIVEFARERNVRVYRGSEEDVLDRFYKTAMEYRLGTIVRVTPDCPMLDPSVMDRVISKYLSGDYDYVSNTIKPTYPDGFDTEIFSFQALERAWREAKLYSEREHVTPYIVKNPKLFRLYNVEKDGEDLSWMRFTVDTPEDYEFISKIFEKLYDTKDIFYMDDILEILRENPELCSINKGISRNEAYRISLQKDKEHEINR